MGTIYMIRHGQASFGAEDYDNLSALGERQAGILGASLAQEGVLFDAVYCGTMRRHRQTAAPLERFCKEKGLCLPGMEFLPEFDEFDAAAIWKNEINWMAQNDPDARRDMERLVEDPKAFMRLYTKALMRWASGEADPAIGPRWRDFTIRVQRGVRLVMERHGQGARVAVFTSGGPICATLQLALELSDAKTMDLGMRTLNASVTRFKFKDKNIALFGYNDVSHLENTGETNLLTYR